MTVSFDTLASMPGLTVFTEDHPDFVEAITSRAFVGNLDKDLFPSAVLVTESTEATQAAVLFCKEHKLKLSVRCGGHNWGGIWLQGPTTVLLDVGKMDSVQFDESTKLVSVGPGASNINYRLPSERFFPGGHCPGVPVGGFLLGGGYGVGFPKYGLSSSSIRGMTVVLPSGEVKTVNETDNDDVSKALMKLARGSYTHFPAVITEFKLQTFPSPVCVFTPAYLFALNDWKQVVKVARDIVHRGDEDSNNVEVTVVFTFAPPPIAEATGNAKMVVFSPMFFGDSEEHARALVAKYTKGLEGMETLVPVGPLEHRPAASIPEGFASFYPEKARYTCVAHDGDESKASVSDEDFCKLLEPVADMWASDACPPPPSHSLLALINPNTVSSRGQLAIGFAPSFSCMTYSIYQDESADVSMRALVSNAHKGFVASDNIYTHLAEGHIREMDKPSFNESGQKALNELVAMLDPQGMLKKD
jgi:FAD/FMN-containing dehydrogenase